MALTKHVNVVYLTSAAGLPAAPQGQRGIDADQCWRPLQMVTHMAAEASHPPGQQVQHRHLPEVRLLWQGAAQPENYDGRTMRTKCT